MAITSSLALYLILQQDFIRNTSDNRKNSKIELESLSARIL